MILSALSATNLKKLEVSWRGLQRLPSVRSWLPDGEQPALILSTQGGGVLQSSVRTVRDKEAQSPRARSCLRFLRQPLSPAFGSEGRPAAACTRHGTRTCGVSHWLTYSLRFDDFVRAADQRSLEDAYRFKLLARSPRLGRRATAQWLRYNRSCGTCHYLLKPPSRT